MKTVTKRGWFQVDATSKIEVHTRLTLRLRCWKPLRVFLAPSATIELFEASDYPKTANDVLLVGWGTGEVQIDVQVPGIVFFETEGAIWVHDPVAQQHREKTSDEIFTTLDRPAQMSPEMLAIHRMMRQNEINRENDRAEMQERMAQIATARAKPRPDDTDPDGNADDTGDTSKDGTPAKKTVRKKPAASASDAKAKKRTDDSKGADSDPLPDQGGGTQE